MVVSVASATVTDYSYTGNCYQSSAGSSGVNCSKAFDGDPGTTWEAGSAPPQFLGRDLGSAYKVNNYSIVSYVGSTVYGPKRWTFEGSPDNSTFTLLDNRGNYDTPIWGQNEYRDYNNFTELTNISALYRYYRINVKSSWNTTYIDIAEMTMNYDSALTPAPTASFTITNTSGYTPLITNFTDTSTGIPTAWNYTAYNLANSTEFFLSTAQNPTITFSTVGNFSIMLNASNAVGFNKTPLYSKWVNTSSASLYADFAANATTGYPGDYFLFTDISGGSPITWDWGWGDGTANTTGSATPTHQYAAVGLYNVFLNVTNSSGMNAFTTKYAYINISTLPAPTVLFSSNHTYSTSLPTAVLFTDSTTTPNFQYRNWSFGDGSWSNTSTYATTTATHSYSTYGDYDVTLYVTNTAGTGSYTRTSYVIVSPATVELTPGNLSINKALTGVMTVRVANLTKVDGIALNLTFNQSEITVTGITANLSDCNNFTLSSSYSNSAGTIQMGVISIDKTLTTPCNFADITWQATATPSNKTSPVNFSTTLGNFVKANTSYAFEPYPNFTAKTGSSVFLTNETFTKTLQFKNAYNLNLISGIQVRISYVGIVNGSAITTTGTYDISSTYGTTAVTASADGYFNITQDVVFNANAIDTFLMTPLSGAPGQTTWYTPQQVRIIALNSAGAPIDGVYITATPLNFTAPSDWTQILIGIQPSVNMSGTTLLGWSGYDGSWVAPVLPSFEYQWTFTNTTAGINHVVKFYPHDTSYRIYIPTTTTPNNTITQLLTSALPFYKINSTAYNLSMIYQDTSGYTTDLVFNVRDYTNGNTLVYTYDYGNPGTSQIIANYTVIIPKGQEYTWQYNATKV